MRVPSDFERQLDGQLKQLHAPHAPATLIPRVLAAVRAWADRPWYERAWFTWPAGWQVASVAAMVLLAAGLGVLLPMGLTALHSATESSRAAFTGDVMTIARRVEMASNVVDLLWRSILAPVLAYAVALIVLICLVCGTFAVTMNRLVLNGEVHS